MSYQVLARKYRPKSFSEVVGQEHVTRTLKNALKQGRLAHAFLFTGPRGVGKTSTARILARAVNCPNVDLQGDAEPCNICETCQALLEDRELDVIEMDAASRTGVDDMRDLIDSSRLMPVAGRKKIYIIDEVHMLSKSAFNAFLKTLEEPPSHVIFILATTDVQKVPATIRSRVQRYDFRPLGPADIAPHLRTICGLEGFPSDDESLWTIARKAEGSLRDAEGLLDQVVAFSGGRATIEETREVLGVLPRDLLHRTTEIIAAQDISQVPAFLESIHQRGIDYTEFLRELQAYWTDLIFVIENIPLSGASSDDLERMRTVSGSLTIEDLFRLVRLAEGLEDSIKWSTLPRARFEVAILRWVSLDRMVSIKELLDEFRGEMAAPVQRSAKPANSDSIAQSPVAQTSPTTQPLVSSPPPVSRKESPSSEESKGEVSGANGSSKAATVELVRELWPQATSALKKMSHGAGTAAESEWEVLALDGAKLTIRCNNASEFAQTTMKQSFPILKTILKELTGKDLLLLPAPPPEDLRETTNAAAPARKLPTATTTGDVYFDFMDRIGGVEVDPGAVKDRK